MESINKVLTAPNAVRVWRGFRLPSLPLDQFFSKLGTVFVPATVKFQIDAGLHSYTPSVPAGLEGKPDYVPDETAVLFWQSVETYWNGFSRLSVRTYTLTHNGCYVTSGQPLSRADFPVEFDKNTTLQVDQPVFLFDKPADWMTGNIKHLVAERPRNIEIEDFKKGIANILIQIQALTPQLDAAIACIGDEYIVYWELSPAAPGTQNPTSGIKLLTDYLTGWKAVFAPAPTFLPIDIYDIWSGMDVQAGSSFNMQFERNEEIK
ncbi:MAG: hypothetical protein QM535_03690 [Limnohabitans sp.]|nr:hypothetical protein [Limnohabitans sp.]